MVLVPVLVAIAIAVVPAHAVSPGGEAALPRVLSLHLCADEWLITLAAPEQIAAVTWLARDSSLTSMAQQARAYPTHRGGAEAILALAPDLVLNVRGASPNTVALLRRFGVSVHEFDIPSRLHQVEPTIMRLGKLLGRMQASEGVARLLRARLVSAAQSGDGRVRRAAVYEARGYSSGSDSLIHDVLTLAGYDNVAAAGGSAGYRHLSLERLVAARPEVLVIGAGDPARPSLAEEMLTHPLLERMVRNNDVALVPPLPWSCGTPAVGAAAMTLANAGRSP